MVVYIDVLIILNIYITYFTLRCCFRFLHGDYKLKRLIAASVFGGLCSLTVLIGDNPFISLFLKLLSVGITVLIAFGFSGIKSFLIRTVLSFGTGMLICGGAFALQTLTGEAFFISVGGYPYMNISVMVLLIATVVIYAVVCLLRRFLDRNNTDKKIRLIIKNKGRQITLDAFSDSGNGLVDFFSGLPVIVCSISAVREILPENINSETDLKGIRLIPWHSVSGGGIIRAFRPDGITADYEGEKKNVSALIGVSEDSSFEKENDAIINPKILL